MIHRAQGLPMKWHKAVALGKRLWGLAGKLIGGLRDWWKNTRAAKRYASCEANSFTITKAWPW